MDQARVAEQGLRGGGDLIATVTRPVGVPLSTGADGTRERKKATAK
jgi:hypothetical protein